MKRHFEVLDGLRGTAAVLVVIFHLFQASFHNPDSNPMHHAYLAVDFFFLLSGFVIGYAYDDRLCKMSFKEFMKVRLIRLHPLVILSIFIGVVSYLLDPFSKGMEQTRWWKLAITFVGGILLVPTLPLRQRWEDTHSLNSPCWSLLQEYLVNIVYGLVAPRLGKKTLLSIVILSVIPLILTGLKVGCLQVGWGWSNVWAAPVRVTFPFFGGLLLYRSRFRIKIKYAYPVLSLTLLTVFLLPWFSYNGLYELACIIFIFPMIVAAGAGSHLNSKISSALCRFSGQISYPIYILHYPFIYIYTWWILARNPSGTERLWIGIGLGLFFILLAWLALKFYDEPLRKKLTAIFRKPSNLQARLG